MFCKLGTMVAISTQTLLSFAGPIKQTLLLLDHLESLFNYLILVTRDGPKKPRFGSHQNTANREKHVNPIKVYGTRT